MKQAKSPSISSTGVATARPSASAGTPGKGNSRLSLNSYPVLIRNKRFAIHLLSAGQQHEAYAFAKKGKDKTQGIEWTLSELGNPLLPSATAIIECKLCVVRRRDRRGEESDRPRAEPSTDGLLPRQDGRTGAPGLTLEAALHRGGRIFCTSAQALTHLRS